MTCAEPVAIAVTALVVPSAVTGFRLELSVPFPSSPELLSPQATTE